MNSTLIIIAIAAVIAVALLVLWVKLGGDVRHYKQMWENEVKMNTELWDRYRNSTDRQSRRQADLDAEVYAKAMQSKPGMDELGALMSSCRQDGHLDAEVYENPGTEELRAQKLLASARKRRASQKKYQKMYRDARHAKGEFQVFDDNHRLVWAKAADCAWIGSGKRWKRVLRSSKKFADYKMTGAVYYEGTMPNPGRKAA